MRAFFDGPEGQRWLHLLLVVLLLIVVIQCGAGVERVQYILKALGLDKRVACSRSHLQQRVITMSAMIRDFGVEATCAFRCACRPPRARSASALDEARAEQASMREVVRGLSTTLHPIDLRSGAPTDEERVVATLESLLDRGYAIAESLGAHHTKAVEKVRRMVPSWGAMLAAWWSQVRARVDAQGLSGELTTLVLTLLIPAPYLDLVRARNHVDAAEREKLGGTLEGLLSRLRAAPAWQALDARTRSELIEMASECAGWFVRCTGSAEGHNGWLRLRSHQLHAVTADWLETQRVLHNFLIRRADGTTAAERLFRATHGDLVEYLTARMPLPAMPRRRAGRVERTAQRLNL